MCSEILDQRQGPWTMLVGEYRMMDDLQDDHLVKPVTSCVNRMISPQMEGKGAKGWSGECFYIVLHGVT